MKFIPRLIHLYFVSSLILILFGFVSIANATEIPPAKCPSVRTIQASQLWIEPDDKQYIAFQNDQQYDTTEFWNFVIFDIAATSIEDANQKAKMALSTLSYNQGPIRFSFGWKCIYNIGFGYTAAAYNPPL